MPSEMGVVMQKLRTFPMEKLCYDLKLEVLEQMNPKDAIELVKVDGEFRSMLLWKPWLADLLNEVMVEGSFKFTGQWNWVKSSRLRPILNSKEKEKEKFQLVSLEEVQQAKAMQSAEMVGKQSVMQPITKQERVEYSPELTDQLPQVTYNDINNPFPIEDFDTSPLGF